MKMGSLFMAITLLVCFCLAASYQAKGTCKSKCKRAFLLCRNKLAKTKEDRLDCAKMYVATFPKCYFTDTKTTKKCPNQVIESYSECVMRSSSYGEKFACNNKKNEAMAKCASVQSKKEILQGSLDTRSTSLQKCNACFGDYDACLVKVKTEIEHTLCLAAKELCSC